MTLDKKLILLSIALATMLFCLPSCCDKPCYDIANPECENYEPCNSRANAEFVLADSLWFGNDNVEHTFITDTFWQNKNIKFQALHDNATYEWKIGTDPSTWHKKEFELFFDEAASGNIPVRLITTNPANPECIGDDGRDTFYRMIYVFPGSQMDLQETLPIFGVFTGSDADKPDVQYDVTVLIGNQSGFIGITGLNNCTDQHYSCLYSYHGFVWDDGNGTSCNNPSGYGELATDNKTLTIRYSVGAVEGVRTDKTFTGIKN